MLQTYDLMEKIQSVPRLSKGQKRISEFISNHYDKAAFMTAAKLGEAANVSESTIVRFATTLGYDGYPGLQKAIQEMVRNRLTSVQRIEITQESDDSQILSEIVKSDARNLRSITEDNSLEVFNAVKDVILSATRLYVIGLRASSPLAQYLGYYLNYIFSDLHVITQGGSEVTEQLARIGPGDVIVGISFPRYSNRTIESMRFARSRGAKTIAITDNAHSPMGKTGDHCLIARSTMASFVDSLVAPMSLLNALIVALSSEKKHELLQFFSLLEDIWVDNAIYAHTEKE